MAMTDPILQEFDREWREGDRVLAKEMARQYVNEHHGNLEAVLGKCSQDEIVGMINVYRENGQEADRIIADMWLLAEYKPQHISGGIHMGSQPVVAEAEGILREERSQ